MANAYRRRRLAQWSLIVDQHFIAPRRQVWREASDRAENDLPAIGEIALPIAALLHAEELVVDPRAWRRVEARILVIDDDFLELFWRAGMKDQPQRLIADWHIHVVASRRQSG